MWMAHQHCWLAVNVAQQQLEGLQQRWGVVHGAPVAVC
jgi:hypothetical protein